MDLLFKPPPEGARAEPEPAPAAPPSSLELLKFVFRAFKVHI